MVDNDNEQSDLLDDLLKQVGSEVGERDLRRFACACCRRIWHLLDDSRSRSAVEVAERHASSMAEDAELAEALLSAMDAIDFAVRQTKAQLYRGVKQAHAEAASYAVDYNSEPEDSPYTYSVEYAAWTAHHAATAVAYAVWLADPERRHELFDEKYANERESQRLLFDEMFR